MYATCLEHYTDAVQSSDTSACLGAGRNGMPTYSQADFQGSGSYAAVSQRALPPGPAPDIYASHDFMNAYGMQPGMQMPGTEGARYPGLYAQHFQ